MAKYFNDSIHGTVEMDEYLLSFIDTPQFQRLRKLYQLGSLYWVFPGATHHRFEHCIGTSYMAEQLVSIIQNKQPALKVTDHDKMLVKLAGLCHDLGHGPFSHTWCDKLIPLLDPYSIVADLSDQKSDKWRHESMSNIMLDYLITENDIAIKDDDLKFVHSLIDPEEYIERPEYADKRFLYDIVANTRNSIDVDKFDYVARDCHYLGMKSSFDSGRLTSLCRVVENEICFPQKEIHNVYELFHMRHRLFKEVYSHKTSGAIDYMICDALYNANTVYNFTEIIHNNDPELFMRLTDNILYEIEYSNNPSLTTSQKIIQRIHNRDLYKFVGQCLVSKINNNVHTQEYQLQQFTASNIADYCTDIMTDDLIVEKIKLDYGMKGNKDPVLSTRFFSPKNINEIKKPNSAKFCGILPTNFEEVYMRVYVKDAKKYNDALHGYEKFLKTYGLL